ncbi:MAG: dihydrolipoyllysine-residue succinyltransferase [Mariprofundaceae bacterium]
MSIEIKVPSLGETESEATLISWFKREGEAIAVDDVLAEIESDKITMEITALDAGVLKDVRADIGEVVTPGQVIGLIEEGEAAAPSAKKKTRPVSETKPAAKPPKVETQAAVSGKSAPQKPAKIQAVEDAPVIARPRPAEASSSADGGKERREERIPMTRLRKRIAERLKQAQNTAAILSTFNEVNMQPVMQLRSRYRDAFKAKHGVDLGLMSFFIKACIEGLRRYPVINAYIDGEDVVYHNYFDIGVAVSSDKGLVVPVLRDVGSMSMAEIEYAIADYVHKAREGGLMPDNLKGGTFSISNGGVFGSMLSTPILNPPQSAILGMHRIEKRAVVEGDAIVARPMMYLALSYDHRLIDGREAVLFLSAVREALEFPGSVMLDL